MQDADQVDYARITAIMHKLADWLEDYGFSAPRQEMEEPGTDLNKAIENPRTIQDLCLIDAFMKGLLEDINQDLQWQPSHELESAKVIVMKAAQALGQCIKRY